MALIAGHAMHSKTHPMSQSLGPLAWPLGWLCFASAALFAYITCCLALGGVSVPTQRQLTAATMAAQAAAFPASHPVLGDRSTAQRRSGAQSAQPAPSSADAARASRSFVQSEAQSAAATANCSVRPVHKSFICACGYTFEVMSPEVSLPGPALTWHLRCIHASGDIGRMYSSFCRAGLPTPPSIMGCYKLHATWMLSCEPDQILKLMTGCRSLLQSALP